MKLLTKKAQIKILESTYTIASLMREEFQDDDLLAWALSELAEVAKKSCGELGARVLGQELVPDAYLEWNRRAEDA